MSGTCPSCRVSVIWARVKLARARFGGRQTKPIAIERCEAGAGNIALTSNLLELGGRSVPMAELVSNATGYRVHAEHCPGALAPAPAPTSPRRPAPRAFSAASFGGKRATGGAR